MSRRGAAAGSGAGGRRGAQGAGTIERKFVVTTASNQEEIDQLRWWQQGDEKLETVAMLEKRHANRHDAAVVAELENWWQAALHGSFSATLRTGEKNVDVDLRGLTGGQLKALTKARYCDVFAKIGLALLEADEKAELESDVAEARANAEHALTQAVLQQSHVGWKQGEAVEGGLGIGTTTQAMPQ